MPHFHPTYHSFLAPSWGKEVWNNEKIMGLGLRGPVFNFTSDAF